MEHTSIIWGKMRPGIAVALKAELAVHQESMNVTDGENTELYDVTDRGNQST